MESITPSNTQWSTNYKVSLWIICTYSYKLMLTYPHMLETDGVNCHRVLPKHVAVKDNKLLNCLHKMLSELSDKVPMLIMPSLPLY